MSPRDMVSQASTRGYAAARGVSVRPDPSGGYSVRTPAGVEYCGDVEDAVASVARALAAVTWTTYELVQQDLAVEHEADRYVSDDPYARVVR